MPEIRLNLEITTKNQILLILQTQRNTEQKTTRVGR